MNDFDYKQTATSCNTLHHTTTLRKLTLHTATDCNRLQQTATDCNTADCNRLQQTATPHHQTATHRERRRENSHIKVSIVTIFFVCVTISLHCTTLQQTATHRNTRKTLNYHTATHRKETHSSNCASFLSTILMATDGPPSCLLA